MNCPLYVSVDPRLDAGVYVDRCCRWHTVNNNVTKGVIDTATATGTVIATATVIDTSANANAGADAGGENASSAANEETASVFYIYITLS